MADIFISYSRKDGDFVRVLHQALAASCYETWVDWNDIPATAAWWKAIEAGIEAAHTCIFVISPDSVASEVCDQEVDHAVKHHKRLIPIVRRDGFDNQQMHPALLSLNWLFFRASDDFDRAFEKLVQAIDTDLEWVSNHTRLLVRAVEWEQKQRSTSLLLRGRELAEAEQWLSQKGPELAAMPTALQIEYVTQARRVGTRRQRLLISTLSMLLFAAVGLGLVAWNQKNLAEQRQIEAEANLEAACRQIFGTLEGFAIMEKYGIQFVDLDNNSVPLGIIFGQEFVRTAHNTFDADCAEIAQAYGWSLEGN